MKDFSSGLLKVALLLCFISPLILKAQTELVPVDHKIYSFFENLSKKGLIDYDNGNIPLSRGEAASFLRKIEQSKEALTPTEKKILDDLVVEFSYDLNKNMDNYRRK